MCPACNHRCPVRRLELRLLPRAQRGAAVTGLTLTLALTLNLTHLLPRAQRGAAVAGLTLTLALTLNLTHLLPRAQRGAAVAGGHGRRAARLAEQQHGGAAHLRYIGLQAGCLGLQARYVGLQAGCLG